MFCYDFHTECDLDKSRSASDHKNYQLVTLKCGLEVLLVSSLNLAISRESATCKAAASMCVATGSFADPELAEGLAHFLEHMVFMGSHKYPSENEYDAFISSHGGECNACTEGEYTSYLFDVQCDNFSLALDIFANCFISPKLNLDSAERELMAIESEFSIAKTEESSRFQQLFCHSAIHGHIIRKFSWGNIESLKTIPARNGINMELMLRSFYRAHYRPEMMKLVVIAPKTIQEILNDVTNSFGEWNTPSQLDNPNLIALPSLDHCLIGHGLPFPVNSNEVHRDKLSMDVGIVQWVVPMRKGHRISISWQLSPTIHLYRKKTCEYISHLLGHEGPGSILSSLKDDDLASGICAGIEEGNFGSNSMYSIFSVSVILTLNGLINWITVISTIYSYINMMLSDGPQEWIFKELQLLAKIHYDYLEEIDESSFVEQLAIEMTSRFGRSRCDLLPASFLYWDWDPVAISQTLALMSPFNARVEIISSSFMVDNNKGGEEEKVVGLDVTMTTTTSGPELVKQKEESESDDDSHSNDNDDSDSDSDSDGSDNEESSDVNELLTEESKRELYQGPEEWFPLCSPPVDKPPSEEPHLGARYWEGTLPAGVLALWSSGVCSDSRLKLPPHNPYIPVNTDIVAEEEIAVAVAVTGKNKGTPGSSLAETDKTEDGKVVAAITTDESSCTTSVVAPRQLPTDSDSDSDCTLWHLIDKRFPIPKVEVFANLSSPVTLSDGASGAVRNDLCAKILSDYLTEPLYLAESADLHSEIFSNDIGIQIHIYGFSDKAKDLFALIISTLRSPSLYSSAVKDSLARVDRQKEVLQRLYENIGHTASNACTETRLNFLKHTSKFTKEAKIDALKTISLDSLESYIKQYLSQLCVEILVIGNLTAQDALSLTSYFNADPFSTDTPAAAAAESGGKGGGRLLPCVLSVAVHPEQPVLRLPPGGVVVLSQPPGNPQEINHCVEFYFQIGPYNHADLMMLELLEQIVSEPYFDDLRTKQQLGYHVSCGVRETYGILGFCFSVTSSAHSLATLQSSIMKFITNIPKLIIDMKKEKFEIQKQALLDHKNTPESNLSEAAKTIWSEVESRRFDFLFKIKQLDILKKIEDKEVVSFVNKFLLDRNSRLLIVQSSHNNEMLPLVSHPFSDCRILNLSDACKFPHFENLV